MFTEELSLILYYLFQKIEEEGALFLNSFCKDGITMISKLEKAQNGNL
jgi:hypothetical protein